MTRLLLFVVANRCQQSGLYLKTSGALQPESTSIKLTVVIKLPAYLIAWYLRRLNTFYLRGDMTHLEAQYGISEEDNRAQWIKEARQVQCDARQQRSDGLLTNSEARDIIYDAQCAINDMETEDTL